ncbi:MAG: hypothetical protein K2I85_06370 [Alistipes sp.]|nr:hypothetical protein [Alistipes sp.]
MNPIFFLRRPLAAALLTLSVVSCAASRGIRTGMQTVVSRQVIEQCSVASASHAAEELSFCEETVVAAEAVPARQTEIAVSLAALASLPDGSRFAGRHEGLAVEALRRGDSVVVMARSDSIPRMVGWVRRTLVRSRSDSAALLAEASRALSADSVRREVRTETVAAPRSGTGWKCFCAGVAACALAAVWLRRRV